ncbi:hypothetical protein THAOC_37260 [Thalassiosira oceanica]|uniref:Uncharacterized protein n=1 Tax=Thalassiosira oceanica TaxID=159749 RepID=K0R6J9_THAOC|nr:hypothetical protein THAOC_37260 [Thalassiosira oceanica]|eukprot:EJK44221.1 hypothetical protein THAOC_37260 [Thalassiosira oceanica]
MPQIMQSTALAGKTEKWLCINRTTGRQYYSDSKPKPTARTRLQSDVSEIHRRRGSTTNTRLTMDRGWKPCIPDRRTSVWHQQMSTRATTARARLQSDYDADLLSGATKYRDGQTSATVYPRGPPRHDRSLPRAQTHATRATRTNPVRDLKRRISKGAATTLGSARLGRNDINHFQGRSHGSLDRKAQRLGRRSGKIPAPGRALNPDASHGVVCFQTRSLRHVGEGAKFVLVTGKVAVPVEDLNDYLSIPNHTLVFHKAPALKVLSKADAATTIQRSG